MLPLAAGFVDSGLMVPAFIVAGRFHCALVAGGVGVAIATAAEGRTAPGREFVDFCRPVIQTCRHCILLGRRNTRWCARLVRVGLPIRYLPLPLPMQCDEKKI